jgi:hypothetical protein
MADNSAHRTTGSAPPPSSAKIFANDGIADWFSCVHDCVFLQEVVLSRPTGDFNSRSFETQVRSFPVLMAFLHLGGSEQLGNCAISASKRWVLKVRELPLNNPANYLD